MKNRKECIKICEELLNIFPENMNYIKKYMQFKAEEAQAPKDTLIALLAKNPKNLAVKRMLLDILTGIEFYDAFSKYVDDMLKKGVPSLFRNIKPLYATQKQNISDLFEMLYQQFSTKDPAYQVWLLALMALHYDYIKSPNAMKLVDDAIKHTSTLPDLYVFKAKIQKHNNLIQEAAATYKEAILLDKSDRNLNARCAKYHLRAGKVKEAEEIMLAFSKDEGKLNVHDMQCMWYEYESGNAYLQLGNYLKAVEEYKWVRNHFDTIIADQYDFHIFCIRKCSLIAYTEMIENNNHFYKSKYLAKAMPKLTEIYLKISTNKDEVLSSSKAQNPTIDEKLLKESLDAIKPIDKAYESIKDAALDNKGVDLHLVALKTFMLKGKWLLAVRSAIYLAKHSKENAQVKDEVSKLKEECKLISR